MYSLFIRCTFRCTLWLLYPYPPHRSSPDLTGWAIISSIPSPHSSNVGGGTGSTLWSSVISSANPKEESKNRIVKRYFIQISINSNNLMSQMFIPLSIETNEFFIYWFYSDQKFHSKVTFDYKI